MVPVMAGLLTALLVAASARLTAFDRDRSFYPTVLIVIASYYLLFAVMGADMRAVVLETGVISMFAALAVLGGFRMPALVGLAIAAHGVFDLAHAHLIDNAGVPPWWPAYCAAVDIPLGMWVIYRARAGAPLPVNG